ncbi:MAG: hypothetical protein ACE5MG_00095 [Candidatus Methylomirabilales bacterium]
MIPSPARRLALAVDGFLFRYKIAIFVLLIGYFVAAHYLFLGFNSWDGVSYRVPPIVELVQNGSTGGWKFDLPAARHFYPFLELVHVPFLKVLGMTGLYFSFSLVLLPLSIGAVYLFVRELTGNLSWATYSALAYLAIPFVNTQAFSGYIDFAVIGALAFYLYGLLKVLRLDDPPLRSLAVLSVATLLLSLSRQQTPYVAILILGVLGAWFLRPWSRYQSWKEGRWSPPRHLAKISLSFGIGIAPAVLLHAWRFLAYGTPIFPYQFKLFRIATDVGLTPHYTAGGAGLLAPGWEGLLASFRRGWVIPIANEWPTNFYDSRSLGIGLFFWLLWIALPFVDRFVKRDTAVIMGLSVGIALVSQDFWLPRWSMTLVLVTVLSIGGALSWLATRGPLWAYFPLLLAVVLHFGRPLYDSYSMMEKREAYYRINLAQSPLFIGSEVAPGELILYPDLEADLLLVHPVENAFSLLLYGRNLSNRIAGVLDPVQAVDSCFAAASLSPGRQTLIVDQFGKLAEPSGDCTWTCDYPSPGRCLAGSLARSG